MKGLRRVAALCALLCLARPIAAQEAATQALDAIRADLSQRRFERALTSIKKLLADPALGEDERVQALDARARAHVGRGELSAAEKDYAELLTLRPELVWDESMGPAKARARFDKSRKAVVGSIRLDVVPEDASVSVDGRELHLGPEKTLPLAAGTHRLNAARSGFDPQESTFQVEPDREAPVVVHLEANSLSVVIRTELPGVAVRLDGTDVGLTASSGSSGPELRLDEVGAGEHVFELSKPCYRTEVLERILTVDLLERAALTLGPIAQEPLRGIVELRGAERSWEVVLNGSSVTRPADDRVAVCPGPQVLEVRAGGRIVYRAESELAADAEAVFDVVPRPNVLVLGAGEPEPRLPDAWSVLRGAMPAADLDLSHADVWEKLVLPPDTDLVLARARSADGDGRFILFSPILGIVAPWEPQASETLRPSWRATTLGARLVDSRIGGSCRVVELQKDSPAARAGILVGDRIVKIADAPVGSVREAQERIAAQPRDVAFPVELLRVGQPRTLQCTGTDTLLLEPEPPSSLSRALRAAWASVDAATLPAADSSAASANLALLLARSGRHAQAVSAWGHVAWPERAGIGAGTAAYYLGVEYAALGELDQAREALRKAAASPATTFRDDGPELAPAARAHLFELSTAR